MTFINDTVLHLMARVEAAKAAREEGASMAEYGLLLALIAIVAAVAAKTLGTNINSMFSQVAGQLS